MISSRSLVFVVFVCLPAVEKNNVKNNLLPNGVLSTKVQ